MHSIHLILVWLSVMKECVASPVSETPPVQPPVHVVIAASRQTDRSILPDASGASISRDRDNGELKYTLRSIAENAPWVERIFVLMNPVVGIKMPEEHWWIPEPEKTVIVDRCTLLDDDDCPTRNGLAVATVVHKIPGLSERFIYTDDDNLLTQRAEVSDFFDGGLPKYWETGGGGTDLYENLAATKLSLKQVPKRFSTSHSWHALTKSVCAKLEGDYPEWFAFVRSHALGRYSSKLNEAGTSASEKANAYNEEDLSGVWAWAMQKYGLGKTVNSGRLIPLGDNRIGSYDESVWKEFVAHPRFIQNINDDLSYDPDLYVSQRAIMIKYLERLFPDPRTSQVLIRDDSRDDQKRILAVDNHGEIGEVPLSEEPSGKATANIDTANVMRAVAVDSHGDIEELSRKVTAKGIETARDNADEGDDQGGEHGGHLENDGNDGDEQLIEAMIKAGSWTKAVMLLKTAAL